MLERKFKEDMDITKIPTFLSYISPIKHNGETIYNIEMSIDCRLIIHHVKSKWEYKYNPINPHFIIDAEDEEFINPWTIKQEFSHGLTRYTVKCSKTIKCEIYIDETKHISTILYMENGELKTKSFPLPVKENK